MTAAARPGRVLAILRGRRLAAPLRALRVLPDECGRLADVGVLSRDLAAGCPHWVDVTGWLYDRNRRVGAGALVPRPRDAGWKNDLPRRLKSGDLVMGDRAASGLSRASSRAIIALPVVAKAGGVEVRRAHG